MQEHLQDRPITAEKHPPLAIKEGETQDLPISLVSFSYVRKEYRQQQQARNPRQSRNRLPACSSIRSPHEKKRKQETQQTRFWNLHPQNLAPREAKLPDLQKGNAGHGLLHAGHATAGGGDGGPAHGHSGAENFNLPRHRDCRKASAERRADAARRVGRHQGIREVHGQAAGVRLPHQ